VRGEGWVQTTKRGKICLASFERHWYTGRENLNEEVC